MLPGQRVLGCGLPFAGLNIMMYLQDWCREVGGIPLLHKGVGVDAMADTPLFAKLSRGGRPEEQQEP